MQSLFFFLKGFFMGAADIVPGISGGTIAFITGIYDRLITALSDLSRAGRLALSGRFGEAWKHVDWRFFIPLTLGLGSAFVIGSLVIPGVMEAWPAYVFAFFVGLVIASGFIVHKHIKNRSLRTVLWIFPGIALGLAVALSPHVAVTPNRFSVLLLGMIATGAMLLPGVSGSYVLVMLGQYEYLLSALGELRWDVILMFKVGAVLGLLVFSRLIKIVLAKYHSRTFYTLLGIMIGALARPIGTILENADATHAPGIVILLVLGIAVVVLTERTASGRKPREQRL